jgi:hypothetical protein
LQTPKDYADLLTRLGGLNEHGEPNFLLHWGSDPVPRKAIGPERFLMPHAFMAAYLNFWCLAEWTSPEEFGREREWESYLGPYPREGMYLPIQVFRNGNEPMRLDSEVLNKKVLELHLWVICNHRHDSPQKRYHYLKDEFDRMKAEQNKQIVEMIADGAPAFIDATSFFGQANCNSVVKQKLDLLERNLSRIQKQASRFPRGGLVQGPPQGKIILPDLGGAIAIS